MFYCEMMPGWCEQEFSINPRPGARGAEGWRVHSGRSRGRKGLGPAVVSSIGQLEVGLVWGLWPYRVSPTESGESRL